MTIVFLILFFLGVTFLVATKGKKIISDPTTPKKGIVSFFIATIYGMFASFIISTILGILIWNNISYVLVPLVGYKIVICFLFFLVLGISMWAFINTPPTFKRD